MEWGAWGLAYRKVLPGNSLPLLLLNCYSMSVCPGLSRKGTAPNCLRTVKHCLRAQAAYGRAPARLHQMSGNEHCP